MNKSCQGECKARREFWWCQIATPYSLRDPALYADEKVRSAGSSREEASLHCFPSYLELLCHFLSEDRMLFRAEVVCHTLAL